MPNPLDASRTAELLLGVYDMPFGGKRLSRYRMPLQTLAELSRRPALGPAFLGDLDEELRARGVLLIQVNEEIVIISVDAVMKFRQAPSRVVRDVHDFLAGGAADDD